MKRAAWAYLEQNRERLESLALDIHAHPELGFEEHRTAAKLCDVLEAEGFTVTRGYRDLPTAFKAEYVFSESGPVITLIAEYDALPDVGHACGHNLICTASVGAAMAAVQELRRAGATGRLQVVGTPAEEGGGGKIILLERGAFQDSDAVMMFHPYSRTMVVRPALAATGLKLAFHGKAAHAASKPHLGVNALDACIQTFNAINAMRQHFPDEHKVHGIITHGGSAANIVPDYAEAKFMVRHKRMDTHHEILEQVIACAEGAAKAVGATVEVTRGHTYAERKNNETMAGRFRDYLQDMGIETHDPPKFGGVGSSDFNNVSQIVPAIHPYIQIVPEHVANHSVEFAAAAGSAAGLNGMLAGAKALSQLAIDLITDAAFLAQVKEEFSVTA